MLIRRDLPRPIGMLPGLLGQRPTLTGEVLVHPRDLLLDLSDRLGQFGDLHPERLALRPRLLGSSERMGAAGIRIGHYGEPGTLPARGTTRHGTTSCP
jgi:hypothetical protein